jgi:hypothetical protein
LIFKPILSFYEYWSLRIVWALLLDSAELAELISIGHELPGLEFKSWGSATDARFSGKIVRAMLGMANRSDGGRIVIGVEQTPTGFVLQDPQVELLQTWTHDNLSDRLAGYADPSVRFKLEYVPTDASQAAVLITVHEFDDVPILCKKELLADPASDGFILKRGGCYVRPRKKPETSELATFEDMRAILDLATQKQLRRYVAQAEAAGLTLGLAQDALDGDLYRTERERIWNS